jgi:putative transposase
MDEIITLLGVLSPSLSPRVFQQLVLIVEAVLSMTGRVTMLGISRWTEEGGSYRTVQRFFKEELKWPSLRWQLVRQRVKAGRGVWLLLGDEVVVTKSGKATHGLGKFFSSAADRAVPGLCFLNLSLLEVASGTAYPLVTEQLVRGEVQASSPKAAAKGKDGGPKGRGRPKGGKDKNKKEAALSPFLVQMQGCIRLVLGLLGSDLSVAYFVYDGAMGNNAALQAVSRTGLHLISKLRHDSVLYLPHTGEYSGRGRRPKYGDRLSPETLGAARLKADTTEKGVRTQIYQAEAWHKSFPDLLNVVVVVKTRLKTGQTGKVLLYSDDLTLPAATLVKYYSLRFQIEFNFRDAKQHWGLEDFMNVGAAQVGNAADLSLSMVTFSQVMAAKMGGDEKLGILDMKTLFRAQKYTLRVIKSLGLDVKSLLIGNAVFGAVEIGRIHPK